MACPSLWSDSVFPQKVTSQQGLSISPAAFPNVAAHAHTRAFPAREPQCLGPAWRRARQKDLPPAAHQGAANPRPCTLLSLGRCVACTPSGRGGAWVWGPAPFTIAAPAPGRGRLLPPSPDSVRHTAGLQTKGPLDPRPHRNTCLSGGVHWGEIWGTRKSSVGGVPLLALLSPR